MCLRQYFSRLVHLLEFRETAMNSTGGVVKAIEAQLNESTQLCVI